MGLGLDLFKDKPEEDFICPICLGVFQRPVVDQCGHTFCSVCLEKCLSFSNRCPLSNCTFKESPREAPYAFRNLLGQLNVQCQYCKSMYGKLSDYQTGCAACSQSQFVKNLTREQTRANRPEPSTSFPSSSGPSCSTQQSSDSFGDQAWVKWAGVLGGAAAGALVLYSAINKSKSSNSTKK